MADDADKIDGLDIAIGGDDEDYAKMVNEVIADTERMAEKVKQDSTKMVEHVVTETKRGNNELATFITTSTGFASPSSHPGSTKWLDMVKGMSGKGATSTFAGGGGGLDVNEIFPELGQMKAELTELATAEKELEALKNTMTAYQKVAEKFPDALKRAAPALTEINPNLGKFATGLSMLGSYALPVTAGLATFAVSVTGVTYAISGWEGVQNMVPNMLELSKIALSGVTLGFVDYTAATAEATRHDKAFAEQQAANQSLIAETKQARVNALTDITLKVDALKDHSLAAEDAFLAALKLGSREGGGFTAGQIEEIEARYAAAFDTARVNDYIVKLREEVSVYKQSKEAKEADLLSRNNANAAQREEIALLNAKKKAIDDAEAAEKKHKKDIEDAAKEAERRAKEARKAHADLVAEGKALHEAMKSPLEKLNDDAKRAMELFNMGVISADDLKRAMDKLAAGGKDNKFKAFNPNDMSVRPGEFNSAEEIDQRLAYLANREGEKAAGFGRPKLGLNGKLEPLDKNAPGARALTKEEQEQRDLMVKMVTALELIQQRLARDKMLVVRPAGLKK